MTDISEVWTWIVAMWPLIVSIPTIVAVVFGTRKLIKWISPIKINAYCTVRFGGGHPNEIQATITNRGTEPAYIVRCTARGTYSFTYIAWKHLKNPFTKLRLYPCIRFGGISYSMMADKSIRLEPNEPRSLSHKLKNWVFSAVFEPYLIVEAEVSTGRVFRSKKVPVPQNWKNIGRPPILNNNDPQSPPIHKPRKSNTPRKVRLSAE